MEGKVEVCATKLVPPSKPLMVKGLAESFKDQKIVMNGEGFIPIKPPKFQTYLFGLTKAPDIYEEW